MEYVFLVCSERSGSNMITKIMDAHSQFCGPSPTHMFRFLLENYDKYGELTEDENWADFLCDALNLFNSKLSVWRTSWTFEKLSAAVKERTPSALLKTIFETEAVSANKNKLFIKENHVENFFNELERDFERPRYVVLVRDPRDMALSWKRSPILRGGVIRAANRWKKDQTFAKKLLTQIAPERSFMLRYEDILTEPEKEIKRLCDFLGVEFEEEMLAFQKNSLTEKNAQKTKDWENLNKPLMKSNFNKYKKELSEDEICYVEAICGDEMDFFGYEKIYDGNYEADFLENKIRPFERNEKEEYMLQPEEERKQRERQHKAMKKIQGKTK